MSNRVYVVATTFTDVTGGVSHGYRMFDDYQKTYNNFQETLLTDDKELWLSVLDDVRDEWDDMLAYAKENGAFINGSWYEGSELVTWAEQDHANNHRAEDTDAGVSEPGN